MSKEEECWVNDELEEDHWEDNLITVEEIGKIVIDWPTKTQEQLSRKYNVSINCISKIGYYGRKAVSLGDKKPSGFCRRKTIRSRVDEWLNSQGYYIPDGKHWY